MSKEEIRAFLSAHLEQTMQEVRQWLSLQLDALQAEFGIDINNKKGNHHELRFC